MGNSNNSSLGWSYGIHKRRLITFSLDGDQKIPDQPPPFYPKPLVEKDFVEKKELVDMGAAVYQRKGCWQCHGYEAPGAVSPYLPASPLTFSAMREEFAAVIRDGKRAARGMPAFPDLSDEQLLSLTHYFRSVAHSLADKSD